MQRVFAPLRSIVCLIGKGRLHHWIFLAISVSKVDVFEFLIGLIKVMLTEPISLDNIIRRSTK